MKCSNKYEQKSERSLKRRYVLLWLNLAKNLPEASSPSDYRLNHPIITNDDTKWWKDGDVRIVDADGKLVEKKQGLDARVATPKRSKNVRKETKDNVVQSQVTRLPGTILWTTPDGWMDDFRVAQEIAVRENKSLFVVFTLGNCPPCISYKNQILTSPTVIKELRKNYILVYLLMGGYQLPPVISEEYKQVFKELLGQHSGAAYPVTILMAGDGTQKSVIMGTWGKFAGRNGQKNLKESYTEQKLAEKFLDFINAERKKVVKNSDRGFLVERNGASIPRSLSDTVETIGACVSENCSSSNKVNLGKADVSNAVKSLVIFPRADPKGTKWKSRTPWRYVAGYPTSDRGKDWTDPEFCDKDWKSTNKPLGDCGGKELMRIADRWPRLGRKLYMRRRFNWKGGRVVKVELMLFHGCGVAFYLNGTRILDKSGRNDDWEKIEVPVDVFAKVLRNGENVLAVSVRNYFGEPYFDCGLTVEMEEEVK